MANNQEELLRQYYELHPELKPKLDNAFLQSVIDNGGNPMPEPGMSVGEPASLITPEDHPMSIGAPAQFEQPPEIPMKQPQSVPGVQPQPIRQVSDEEALGGMQSKPQSSQNLSDIMFGKNILSTVDNLKKAQADRDSNQNSARFLRGAALAGEGMLGLRTHRITGPDKDPNRAVNTGANELADSLEKNAGQPIQDLEQQVAMQKQDPNSSTSQGYRDMMKQFGVNVQGDASATDIEKIAPWIVKAYESEESRKQQSQLSKDKALDRNALLKIKGAEKESADLDKLGLRMGDDIDPNRPKTGEFGKNQARLNAAGRVKGLIEASGGNPSRIPMRELATTVGNMLTMGSQTSVTQINELVPHTLQGDAAGIAEWFTGNPTGAEQQNFVKLYDKIASREAEIAKNQMNDAIFQKSYSKYSKLKEKDPEDFYNKLSIATDLDTEEIKALESEKGFRGRYKPSQYSEAQEKGIQKVMDHNGVSKVEAIKALQKAGKL